MFIADRSAQNLLRCLILSGVLAFARPALASGMSSDDFTVIGLYFLFLLLAAAFCVVALVGGFMLYVANRRELRSARAKMWAERLGIVNAVLAVLSSAVLAYILYNVLPDFNSSPENFLTVTLMAATASAYAVVSYLDFEIAKKQPS